ncbi:MAG: hypothetical protein AB1894_26205 [Chloroflexota bacterium]
MRTMRTWQLGSLALALSALALGYSSERLWIWALLLVLLAVFVRLALPGTPGDKGTALFVLLVAAAAVGVLNGVSSLVMLVAVLFALSYWDLEAFDRRLGRIELDEATQLLQQAHLKRLLVVLGVSLILGLTGIAVQIRLSVGWGILLGLMALMFIRLGLSFYRGARS